MILTESIIIKKCNPLWKELDYLCFLSKNLYNQTLYEVKRHYFDTKKYLNYFKVNEMFRKGNFDSYRALPAKVAQGSQRLVERDMLSFFELLKLKLNCEYDSDVKPPRYADKVKGRKPVIYQKQALSFKLEGFIKLSKTNIYIPNNRLKEDIKEVRIIPKNGFIKIEIVYKVDAPLLENNSRYASIDLGINNLATITSNVMSPIIINGKPLKSINQYYNKILANEKSYIQKIYNRKSSNKIRRIHLKATNKKQDYMHKSTTYITNLLVANNINTLVIGYNKGWKQDVKMRKATKQTFIQIPYSRFIQIIKYKCSLQGITVKLQEESYTSKCSFLDNEPIEKQDAYKGKRVKRGLFLTKQGIKINADVNGSYNILKKYLINQVAWNLNIFKNCVEVCSTPIKITIS